MNTTVNFKQFNEILQEGYGQNEQGVFHEILTGYYLNGGKHMKDPKGRPGETSQQAHDRLHKITHEHGGQALIDDHHKKAKAAAEDLKRRIEAGGHKVQHVHWSSKSGDIKRITGVESSQKEDPSDIVVTTNKGKHVGVSLKVSKKTGKVPASNLGQAFSGRKTSKLAIDHKKAILQKYPSLANAKNKESRKQWAKDNPEAHKDIKSMNQKALGNTAKKQSRELSARMRLGHTDHVINHLKQVMHAHSTPMQAHGHEHIKHTTWNTASGVKTAAANPGQDHEALFNDIRKNPKELKISHTAGGTVNFHFKGKKIAAQSHKFDSQSDPLSTMKSAGRIA